jgi:hypothetical protein
MPLDAPTVLKRLVEGGELVLGGRVLLDEQYQEAAAAANEPGAGLIGLGDETRMLIVAIRNAQGNAKGAWAMIVGALLPMVRAALHAAIDERRNTMSKSDPEAQPDYRRGGGPSR